MILKLQGLFSWDGLLRRRAIGPAIARDMVRYLQRRGGTGAGMAEAVGLYLMPQLEGLEREAARAVLGLLVERLTGWASEADIAALQRDFKAMFPDLLAGV